jgi:hypothetical protein
MLVIGINHYQPRAAMPHSFFSRILLAATALSLGACAGRDLNYSQMQAMMPAKSPDKGRVYFYREAKWLGNSITPDIVMGGKVVGTSNPGAFFYVDRDPGDYTVYCGKGEHNSATLSLAAGQEVYVHTAVGNSIVKSEMTVEVEPLPVAVPVIHSLNYFNTEAEQ